MDNKLKCEIVNDLLPTYIDGLTSSVTAEAVKEHLSGCVGCSSVYKNMTEPEPKAKSRKSSFQVDFLKKIRNRFFATSIALALVAVTIVLSIGYINTTYFNGKVALPNTSFSTTLPFSYTLAVNDSIIKLSGIFPENDKECARVIFEENDGILKVSVYSAPPSIFNKSSFDGQYIASENIAAIYINDLIAWENGKHISQTAAQLFRKKTPYIGDAVQNIKIADILGVSRTFGGFTSSLHTSGKPCTWKLMFDGSIISAYEAEAKRIMLADSYLILSVIGNMDSIIWEYNCDGIKKQLEVSSDEASNFVGKDIKKISLSASEIQSLMNMFETELWSGIQSSIYNNDKIQISVENSSSIDLSSLRIKYCLNGKVLDSFEGDNMNGSDLKKGEHSIFTILKSDLWDNITPFELSQLSFSLSAIDASGMEIVICEAKPFFASFSWVYSYTLTGDSEKGFVLEKRQ